MEHMNGDFDDAVILAARLVEAPDVKDCDRRDLHKPRRHRFLRGWESPPVPGLLQTPEYARGTLSASSTILSGRLLGGVGRGCYRGPGHLDSNALFFIRIVNFFQSLMG